MEQEEYHLDYIKNEEESIIEIIFEKQMETSLLKCLKMLHLNVSI